MSRKTQQHSIDHINLLNAIKARSGVEVCHASNETLAKDLGVSVSTVKRLLDDMQRPVAERTSPSKERKRVPLGLGWIEIVTGRPFHQGGKMCQHREIYIIDRTSCDEKGAYLVAALAAEFGLTTKREDGYFCGQLQCTKGQFERWLELAQELDLVSVSVDETDGRRVITRIAKGVSDEVELPDTLRLAASVEVDGKRKLVSSRSVWTPHPKRSVTERLQDALRSECAERGACTLKNAQLVALVGEPERTVKRALAGLIAAGQVHVHRLPTGCGWGRILADRVLSSAEVEAACGVRRGQPPDLPMAELASREELAHALRLHLDLYREQHPYLPDLPEVEAEEGYLDDALGQVWRMDVHEWAKTKAGLIYEPLLRRHWEAEEERWASDAAGLMEEFVSTVQYAVEQLNNAWNPKLVLDQAEVVHRAGALRAEDLHHRAYALAEELHREHRLRTMPSGRVTQPGPDAWVDASTQEVQRIVSADWRRATVGRPYLTPPPPTDEEVAEAIVKARDTGTPGWVAYHAADLLYVRSASHPVILAMREQELLAIAAACRPVSASIASATSAPA